MLVSISKVFELPSTVTVVFGAKVLPMSTFQSELMKALLDPDSSQSERMKVLLPPPPMSTTLVFAPLIPL